MPLGSIIRTSRLARVPWKNGAGTTREGAVFPDGAGPDSFWWRISVADIIEDAAFSTFPGTDRHFLLATAGTLTMDVDGARRTAAYGRPETFPGEADVSVRLSSGPTSVINLITKHPYCTGDVSVERLDGPLIPHVNAVALVLLNGAAWIDSGERLEPLDFLICGPTTEGIQFKEALVATISVFP
ncbi:HutD/Ves family protein [Pseudarthrobacter sp. S9]|uniref:HutD/Ves family protein n=1 Tax=Pseudarthrobacter sp. S9 TaxID=3418421 RepID=UPI003D07376C